MNQEQLQSSYDAIVIGAGAAGLSTAAALAKNGQSVLVAEKNDCPGGVCTAYSMGDYTFDYALHQVTGVGSFGASGGVLEEYGIADRLDFKEIDPFMVFEMPDRSYKLRGNWEAIYEELVADFPGEADGLRRLMDRVARMRQDCLIGQRLIYGLDSTIAPLLKSDVTPGKYLSFPYTMGRMLTLDANRTAARLLGPYLQDPRAFSVLTASWPYLGLPPSELSGVMCALFIAGHGIERQYFPVGGSARLTALLVEAIQERGGQVLTGAPVQKVLVENGTVTGVELPDGRQVRAGVVISNASAGHLYGELIDPDHTPQRYVQKLKKMPVSVSPFLVHLGLDYDVSQHGLPYFEHLFYDTYDHDQTWRRMQAGEAAMVSAYSPVTVDRGMAPEGHSTLILTMMLPYHTTRDWRQHKETLAEEMIRVVERRVPDLSQHVVVKRILTPDDVQGHNNSTQGAMYGWAITNDQVLTRRLAPKSPIRNLYHVGMWTQPGPGINVALLSGWLLASQLKKKHFA